jgi:hypothetical protein
MIAVDFQGKPLETHQTYTLEKHGECLNGLRSAGDYAFQTVTCVTYNETLSIAAMCANNSGRSPVRIKG